MRFQSFDHLFHCTPTQPLLLSPSPSMRAVSAAGFRGLTQIFADVIEITEKGRLLAEDLPALQLNPLGPITQRMNPPIESPASVSSAVPPAAPRLLYRSEGGCIHGAHASL